MDRHPDFIRLAGLSKGFLEGGQLRSVLQDADASFARGEFVAILGKSGSGKSTLLNLISGIDLVDGGDIWVNGQSLTALDEHQRTLFRRRNIGFIFQFFNLIPTLTVWENVILPLELAGVANGEIRQRAEPLLDAVGLLDRKNTFPDRLSGGEQQRVAIARALVNSPPLILADEPTGNLDTQTTFDVMEIFRDLHRKGTTLVLATQDTGLVRHYPNRVIHLSGGKKVDSETI